MKMATKHASGAEPSGAEPSRVCPDWPDRDRPLEIDTDVSVRINYKDRFLKRYWNEMWSLKFDWWLTDWLTGSNELTCSTWTGRSVTQLVSLDIGQLTSKLLLISLDLQDSRALVKGWRKLKLKLQYPRSPSEMKWPVLDRAKPAKLAWIIIWLVRLVFSMLIIVTNKRFNKFMKTISSQSAIFSFDTGQGQGKARQGTGGGEGKGSQVSNRKRS